VIDRLLVFLATLCVAGSYVPQIVKAYQTKSTGDLSWGTFVVGAIGLVLWIVYGLRRKDHNFVVANIAIFLLLATLSFLKFLYG